MKVLFDYKIFFSQKYGGPSRYFANLFENLNKIETNAIILSPFYINEYLKKTKYKEKIIGVKFPKIKYSGFILNILNKKISEILFKKIEPNVIHTTYYDNFIFNKKKPLVVTVHDLIHEVYHYEFGYDKNYRPKKEILDQASHVVCVSNSTKSDLLKYYKIKEDKISVIYHGSIEADKQNITHTLKKVQINQPFFLYVGSRKRYKNFFTLINAFLKNEKIYNNFNIVCFGGGKILNSEKKILNEKKFDLKKIINFPGHDDELLYSLYKNAEALIYPSSYEGFGMPILESMSIGCPVISSNSSSLPEVYGDGALSFDPTSSEELSNCIYKIADEPGARSQFIEKGKLQAQKFTWENCSKQTLGVYQKLI